MRYLKTKVARARQICGNVSEASLSDSQHNSVSSLEETKLINLPPQNSENLVQKQSKNERPKETRDYKNTKVHTKDRSKAQTNSAKNIVKNYGRAIASFCLSEIASLYLDPLILQECVKIKEFQCFISTAKDNIDGISSLRRLLVSMEGDNETTMAFKRIFQKMSVVFIKYFSVNWIFGSRLKNKIAHLNCRFKMMRRVKDPAHFTYLKA